MKWSHAQTNKLKISHCQEFTFKHIVFSINRHQMGIFEQISVIVSALYIFSKHNLFYANCYFNTACKRSWGKVKFYSCLSVHKGKGWIPSMHHSLHDSGSASGRFASQAGLLTEGSTSQGVCIQGVGRPLGLTTGGGEGQTPQHTCMEYSEIWSTNGWFASCWNAYLLHSDLTYTQKVSWKHEIKA